MKKYKISMIAMMICLLVGCSNIQGASQKIQPQPSSVISSQTAGQAFLFEAKDMESIQLTGQEILDGKEADMSVKISDAISMDFHIARDNPNGTKLYAIYNSQAYNLAVNYISPDVFDNDEAIAAYSYQICCYDFNNDGIKEVVVAAGNQNDQLSIFVFYVNVDAEFIFYPENYILGYQKASVNENNEICVPSPNGVKTYRYNISAEDAEYAKLSGPIKISVDYATKEQLDRFKTFEKYVKDEGGSSLLILPKEALEHVTVCRIEYNAQTDRHDAMEVLYQIPVITPDAPLILQANMPDFPIYGVSYTDKSGTEQFCGIGESMEDGTVYLFEMRPAKG